MTTGARATAGRSGVDDTFAEVERLLFNCETTGHFEQAQSLLAGLAAGTSDAKTLARVYGQRAHVAALRFDYVEQSQRLGIAEAGVKAAKQGLALDPSCLEANTWGAATMGLHGLEMGVLSSLFYLRSIRDHALAALRVDEAYASALAHQILADVYRLSPPAPVGIRDRAAALDHLLHARELAPECPMAKLRLAELYLSLRKKSLAAEQLDLVLAQRIEENGPVFADRCHDRARDLMRKARS